MKFVSYVILMSFHLLTHQVISEYIQNDSVLTTREYESDWRGMADGFNLLVNASSDGLVMAKMIHQKIAGFMKLSYPVGAIFAGALSFGLDSPEQKAISDLRIELNRGFKQTALIIKYAVQEIIWGIQLNDFKRDILEPKIQFQKILDFMTNGTIKKTKEDISDFVNKYCQSGRRGPLNILSVIGSRMQDCTGVNLQQKNVELIIQWKRMLRRIAFDKIKNQPHHSLVREFDDCTNEVFRLLSERTIHDSNAALGQVEDHFFNSEAKYHTMKSGCNIVTGILNNYYANYSPCILKTILEATQFTHSPLHQFAALVSSVVLDLVNYGIFCSNITYGNRPETYSWYNESLRRDAEQILNILLSWIPTNLEKSWPKYEMELVQDIVAKDKLPIFQEHHYTALNKKIITNLTQYGRKGFSKQILTFLAWRNDHYNISCLFQNCFTLLDLKNANIFVTRFNETEYWRSVTAKQWLVENKASINNSVYIHRHTSPEHFDAFFCRETGKHLLQEENYQNMVILYDRGYSCETSLYRIYGFQDRKVNGFASLDMYFKETLISCTEVRFLFFI